MKLEIENARWEDRKHFATGCQWATEENGFD